MQILWQDLRCGAQMLLKKPSFMLMAVLATVSVAQTPRPPAVTSPQLLPNGKMLEMLVLMPPADVLLKGGSRADNLKEFEPLLLKEFLPQFEQRYRVLARPESRAIAGLSLGGELALTVGLRHPETFRWVASLSGSLFEKDFPDRFGAFLDRPAAPNTTPKLLWIGCGAGDLFLPGAKKLSEILPTKGIKHTLRETEGYHTWLVWRPYLAEVLPLLFR